MKRWTFALPALALLLGVLAAFSHRTGHAAVAAAMTPAAKSPLGPVLAASDWIDGRPNAAALAGKVVVVDVFTVDCGNCQNVVPTLRTLYAADRARGLVVIGVHSPETPGERNRSYVTDSLQRQGIVWPVAVDNSFNLWNAYGVSAWPTELFFDRHGRLRGTITGDSQDDSVKSRLRRSWPSEDERGGPRNHRRMKRKAILIENEILPPGITRKPFSDALRAGKTLYVSGRIGLDASTGKPPEAVTDEAQALMENLKGVLDAADMKMKDLVQITVFCPDLSQYAAFNDVYLSYFDGDLPARAFVGSGPLLFGARFELTAIAVSR